MCGVFQITRRRAPKTKKKKNPITKAEGEKLNQTHGQGNHKGGVKQEIELQTNKARAMLTRRNKKKEKILALKL